MAKPATAIMTPMRALADMWKRPAAICLLAAVGATLALAPAPAAAQAYVDTEALDYFFDQLRAAPDAMSAQIATDEIWFIWLHPDDPQLADAFEDAMRERAAGHFSRAVELLDKIIETWPDYAEGWNQRATMNYILGNLEASLADVKQTLVREPRHFGALSGGALIYLRLGDRPAALQMMRTALSYHRFLNERRLFPELLTPEVEI
jgi:tetratricopeptide (TPR) repeat protein